MNKTMRMIKNYLDIVCKDAKCELNYQTPYQLLVAVILSAQCTDKRVNIVTGYLFKKAKNPFEMTKLNLEELENIIKPCGLYHAKAKAILEMSNDLIQKYNGNLPEKREELMKLRGVGRKTANVVLSNCFNGDEIAVDTHILRIAKRLNLVTDNATPYETEMALRKNTEPLTRTKTHHQLISFGRNICTARNPKCDICELKNICKYYKKSKKNIQNS